MSGESSLRTRTIPEPGLSPDGAPAGGRLTAASSTGELVAAAAAGSRPAWELLVARYHRLVWAVVRRHGLSEEQAHDVFQTTWLRLADHLEDIRKPESLASWLGTTARRECWRVMRRARRSVPTDTLHLRRTPADQPPVSTRAVAGEQARALREAIGELDERGRQLLGLVLAEASYQEIAAVMDMPVGSIGPTRRRYLDKLRHALPDWLIEEWEHERAVG